MSSTEPLDDLREWHPTFAKFDDAKRQARTISGLYAKAGMAAYASRIANCAEWVLLSWRQGSNQQGEEVPTIIKGQFCRCRWCPVCQVQRCRKNLKRLMPVAESLRSAGKMRVLFVTLTVRNVAVCALRESLQRLSRAFSALMRFPEFHIVRGYVRALELTRTPDGEAHPHIHAFLFVLPCYFNGKNYLSQVRFTALWKAAAKLDYTPIVHVKAVRDQSGGLRELLKYPMKIQDLSHSAEWLAAITTQTHRLRLLSTGGEVKKRVRILDDGYDEGRKERASALKTAEITTFRFSQKDGRYKRTRATEAFRCPPE